MWKLSLVVNYQSNCLFAINHLSTPSHCVIPTYTLLLHHKWYIICIFFIFFQFHYRQISWCMFNNSLSFKMNHVMLSMRVLTSHSQQEATFFDIFHLHKSHKYMSSSQLSGQTFFGKKTCYRYSECHMGGQGSMSINVWSATPFLTLGNPKC